MNDRDKRFCTEYMVDMDAKAAAIRAGFRPSTARNAAAWIHQEHPTKPKLREEIDRLIEKRARRTEITADRVLQELARIAFVNITDVVTPQGGLKPDVDRDDSAAVSGVKIKYTAEGTEREVKLHDKGFALRLLGMHLGMFIEKPKEDESGKKFEVEFSEELEEYAE